MLRFFAKLTLRMPVKHLNFLNNYRFSENLSSSFKSRSRLTEFFKYTHPDILTNAPEKVKEENLRSIKILNSYLDACNHNKGCQEEQLKFYIAEKSSVKNKKYSFFEVALPPLKADAAQDVLGNHITSVVKLLLRHLKMIREDTTSPLKKMQKLSKSGKKTEEGDESEAEDQEKLEDYLNPNKKMDVAEAYLRKRARNMLEKSALSHYTIGTMRKSLMKKIEDELYIYNDNSMPRKEWVNMVMQDNSAMYNDLDDYGLAPSIIFFHESLDQKKVDKFLKLIKIPDDDDAAGKRIGHFEKLRAMSKIFLSSKPPINLLISSKYGANDIPGFLTIPYNFKFDELYKYVEENIEDVIEARKQYDEIKQRLDNLRSDINANVQFQKVEIASENLKDVTTMEKMILHVKRIKKFLSTFPISQKVRNNVKHYGLNLGANEFGIANQTINIPNSYEDKSLVGLFQSLDR